jgi:hypothetical protein
LYKSINSGFGGRFVFWGRVLNQSGRQLLKTRPLPISAYPFGQSAQRIEGKLEGFGILPSLDGKGLLRFGHFFPPWVNRGNYKCTMPQILHET